MEEAEEMFPPTPDRFINDAKALIYGTAPEPYKKSQKTNELRVIAVASALHSIQAQTIREMTEMVQYAKGYSVVRSDLGNALDRVDILDDCRSYAKDKGIEIE
jgi:hypothetical protein